MRMFLLHSYLKEVPTELSLSRLAGDLVTTIKHNYEDYLSLGGGLTLKAGIKVSCSPRLIPQDEVRSAVTEPGDLELLGRPMSSESQLANTTTKNNKLLKIVSISDKVSNFRILHDGAVLVNTIESKNAFFLDQMLFYIDPQNPKQLVLIDIDDLYRNRVKREIKLSLYADPAVHIAFRFESSSRRLWHFNERAQLCRNDEVMAHFSHSSSTIKPIDAFVSKSYYGMLALGVTEQRGWNSKKMNVAIYSKWNKKKLFAGDLGKADTANFEALFRIKPQVQLLIIRHGYEKRTTFFALSSNRISKMATLCLEDFRTGIRFVFENITFSLKNSRLLVTIQKVFKYETALAVTLASSN